MKDKKILIFLLISISVLALPIAALSSGGNNFLGAMSLATPSTSLKLDSTNAPAEFSEGHAVTHPDAYHSSTFTYEGASAVSGKHVKLAANGYIEKDVSYGLDNINIKADKDLVVLTGFEQDTYVSKYTVAANESGTTINVCGNYVKVLAEEVTEISEITFEYACAKDGETHSHDFVSTNEIVVEAEGDGIKCRESGQYANNVCSHCYIEETNYVFYAVDDKVFTSGTANKSLEEYCVGKKGSGDALYVDYRIHSDVATTATMKFWMSRNSSGYKATEAWATTVNGVTVSSDAAAPAEGYPSCFENYDVLNVGTVSLNAGDNLIHMVYADGRDWQSSNLRAIFLQTAATLTFKDYFKDLTVEAIDDSVFTNGKKNYDEHQIGGMSGLVIELAVNFEYATTATMIYTVSKVNAAFNVFELYPTKINGVSQTTSAVMSTEGTLWETYHNIELGRFNFNAGVNIIHIEYDYSKTGWQSANFRSLTLKSLADMEVVSESLTIKGCDAEVVTNGNKNTNEDCIGSKDGLTIDIAVDFETATVAKLTYNVSITTAAYNVFTVWPTSINGVAQTTSAVMRTDGSIWFTYYEIEIGTYSFNAGVNIIHIEYDYSVTSYNNSNFRGLTLQSVSGMSVTTPNA